MRFKSCRSGLDGVDSIWFWNRPLHFFTWRGARNRRLDNFYGDDANLVVTYYWEYWLELKPKGNWSVVRKFSFEGLYLLATHSLSSGGSGSAVSFPLWLSTFVLSPLSSTTRWYTFFKQSTTFPSFSGSICLNDFSTASHIASLVFCNSNPNFSVRDYSDLHTPRSSKFN